ncbi:type VII secretion integral membrane protein EccD [Mycolicibacterium wolinskyi]|uniref:Type VII secretion integral membrane protein EccD n=1 Tax=Mycolicibacterium wolinskyi TaxID=59750 RepID=A0A1X2F926_9MYCO|nr:MULTISPECIES: type VII secretion integral membrane protein EccD [Mycolicibacterium]MCV7287532.1 type VII secretion integral membrane protein EccD [Mycolicibacterium wolinskyi]MCV7294430.1 type VII secretion integral membrane protein EccD [Mycolicibacterium goodii]ORX14951.1 type VII secretion integral membrane protein EccD [Mycolicibacterium wolinskyi]
MSENTVMPIVRVAVLAAGDDGGRLTEMALPSELPLREILPAVQRIVLPAGGDDGASAPDPVRLSLAPVGGAPFSLDATLDTVGVVDGDLLALQAVPAGPPAPRIVEDIADAAVIFSAARQHPWGAPHIARAAALALIGLILVGTGLAVAHRVITDEMLGLFVVSGIAVATVLGALSVRGRFPVFGTALAVTALVPVAAAFALGVPGEFGAPNVLLAAAGVAAWSLISMASSGDDRGIAVFTATAVAGIGVLLVAGAAALWELSSTILGCALVLLGLLVTVQAAQLSAMWARFPLPVIPAPGDPTPAAQPLSVLADLPRRVRVSQSHQTGVIAAGVLLAVTGSLALVGSATASPWAWYIVVAAAAGAALRARVWDSAACKAWLLGHSYLLTVVLLVAFAIDGRYEAAWWALAVLAALVLVWVVAALNPAIANPETYSLPMRRLVGFLASGIDASLIPVMAFLVGLFSLVLDR